MLRVTQNLIRNLIIYFAVVAVVGLIALTVFLWDTGQQNPILAGGFAIALALLTGLCAIALAIFARKSRT
jgi:uncharacterized membrane protein